MQKRSFKESEIVKSLISNIIFCRKNGKNRVQEKMKNRILFVIVALLIIVGSAVGVYYYTALPTPSPSPSPTAIPTPTPYPRMDDVILLLENGEERLVGGGNSELLDYLYLSLFHQINVQECNLTWETVGEIKANDRIARIEFRIYGHDLTISQWIKPEDRNGITTDEHGYRVLDRVHDVLFILKDNLGLGLEGHILLDIDGEWSSWAIQKDGEIDKSWIEETERYLLTPTETYLTFRNGTESQLYLLSSYLSYGVFEENITIPLKGRSVNAGDPAVIIRGQFISRYDRDYYFAITGDLYNSKGEKLEGAEHIFDLPTGEFTVTSLSSPPDDVLGIFELHFKYDGQDIEHYDLYLYMEPLDKPPP